MLETDQRQRIMSGEVEKKYGRNSKELKELWEKQTEVDKKNIAILEEMFRIGLINTSSC